MSIVRDFGITDKFAQSPANLARILTNYLNEERDRWLLWLPLFTAVGVAIYFALPVEPPLWLAGVLVALALGLLMIFRPVGLQLLLLMLLALALGFAAATWRTARVDAPQLTKRLGPVDVVGRIETIEHRDNRVRVVISTPVIERLSAAGTPSKVRVSLPEKFLGNGALGDRIRVLAVLMPPPEPMSASGFDFSRYAFFRQLGAVGFALGTVEILPQDQVETKSVTLYIQEARRNIGQRIKAAVPGRYGGLANAFMTGDRGGIEDGDLTVLRNSGLAHLLAISGLHMGLIVGWLFIFIRVGLALFEPLALHYPIKKWAAGVAMIGGLAYLLLTGATIPTQRAFIMVGIVLVAIIYDRTPISMRSVAWAAMIILLFFPESLMSASFQMSFAAVTALVAVYESASTWMARQRSKAPYWRRGLLYFASVSLTTLVASTATAPFALYHFNQMAVYSLAANLIAVPVMAFWVMPAALVSFLAMPVGLEYWPLWLMEQGVALIVWVAATVASWPQAVFRIASPPTLFIVAISLGGIWLCLWRRQWRYFGVAGIALGMIAIAHTRQPLLIIEGSARLIGIYQADGHLLLSSARTGKSIAEYWYRRHGLPVPTTKDRRRMTCDTIGCALDLDGLKIALVKDARALAEDCAWADIVVAFVPTRWQCRGPALVFDRFDIWRHGSIDVYLENGHPVMMKASTVRGRRPWVRERISAKERQKSSQPQKSS
jgi:competence protein ComEC